ncbi:MAG: DMT family transporter [Proteobacteria bacterium]|nr:DMT family transporter [Pseudomonadota bacterium]
MSAVSPAQHRLGLIVVAAAALCWSMGGYFTRIIGADLMTLLFWRGIFSGSAVLIMYCLLERRFALGDLRRLGWPGLGVAFFSATSMICGIGAIRYTSVADAMVIYATAPFMAAGLAWLIFGERSSRMTILAAITALVGVVIMLWGSSWGGSMFGKLLAVFMALSMASFSVLMRGHRDLPMMLAMALSGYLVSIFCFAFADPMGVSLTDFGLIAIFGVVQNALGLFFYTLGTKRVTAGEATLLASLEVPFTPLWVWLFLGEAPPAATMLGGTIVLVALFSHIGMEFVRSSRAVAAARG